MQWHGRPSLLKRFSAPDVAPGTEPGDDNRFYPQSLSQEGPIVRKRKEAPNSLCPFTGHSQAERQGKGRLRGLPLLL